MIAAISANKHYLTEPLSITDALATAAVGVLFVGLVAVASSGVPRRMAGLIAFRKELENFLDQSFMSYSYLICREAEACNHIHFRLTNSAVQIRFAEQAMREQQQNQPNANHSAALQQAWNAFIPLFEYFKSLGLAKLGDDDGYGEYFRLADEKLAKLGDK